MSKQLRMQKNSFQKSRGGTKAEDQKTRGQKTEGNASYAGLPGSLSVSTVDRQGSRSSSVIPSAQVSPRIVGRSVTPPPSGSIPCSPVMLLSPRQTSPVIASGRPRTPTGSERVFLSPRLTSGEARTRCVPGAVPTIRGQSGPQFPRQTSGRLLMGMITPPAGGAVPTIQGKPVPESSRPALQGQLSRETSPRGTRATMPFTRETSPALPTRQMSQSTSARELRTMSRTPSPKAKGKTYGPSLELLSAGQKLRSTSSRPLRERGKPPPPVGALVNDFSFSQRR